MKFKYITVLAIMIISGCATNNPYSGEKKLSNSATGALLGGIGCALVGAIKSGKHARNAGLGCAAIGAGVGHYMDRQETALRKRLKGAGVGIKRNGDRIELVLPSAITFVSSSAELSEEIKTTLDSVARVLTQYDKTRVNILGHTDSVGSYAFNQSLSENRAKSVRWVLVRKGLNPSRLTVHGKSFSQPKESNNTAQGRAQNRRVEISIQPI